MIEVSYSLSDLCARIAQSVANDVGSTLHWVKGEVSVCTYRESSNSYFFELVEKHPQRHTLLAKVSAVAFGSYVNHIREFEETTHQKFEAGVEVLLQVAVHYHELYGLQLHVRNISSAFTLGQLMLQKRVILDTLVQRNPGHAFWINGKIRTFNQQLPLGLVIQHLAVVTSSTAAGLQDFQSVLKGAEEHMNFSVDYYYSPMQGTHNEHHVVEAFKKIHLSNKLYDAVVLLRGGGSNTDLLLFDQYQLVRAIARFPLPVICGLGHQKDQSLCDLCAHTSVVTPTQAANFIINHNQLFLHHLDDLAEYVSRISRQIIDSRKVILSQLNQQIQLVDRRIFKASLLLHEMELLVKRSPASLVKKEREQLGSLPDQLLFAAKLIVKERKRHLDYLRDIVEANDPKRILAKGYAAIKRRAGSKGPFQMGEEITAILADKALDLKIERIHEQEI